MTRGFFYYRRFCTWLADYAFLSLSHTVSMMKTDLFMVALTNATIKKRNIKNE